MFGYIGTIESELKVREAASYKSWYCGLCKCMKRRYGPLSTLFLQYDCAFLDEANAMLTYEEISACESDGATLELPKKFSTINNLYLGMDIGRKKDRSIIWLYEEVGDVFWSRMVLELNKMKF